MTRDILVKYPLLILVKILRFPPGRSDEVEEVEIGKSRLGDFFLRDDPALHHVHAVDRFPFRAGQGKGQSAQQNDQEKGYIPEQKHKSIIIPYHSFVKLLLFQQKTISLL